MVYSYRKLPNQNLYIVKVKKTGRVLGKTKDPIKMIKAIIINEHKK